ncbi:hypothetical protein BLSTO_02101 [Blastocystis sp. subtype 1]
MNSANNPFLQLLGSVANQEGLLKEVMLSVQEGSSFEFMHDTVFFLVDSTVLSPFDWINSSRAPLFMVAKMPVINDIRQSDEEKKMMNEDMNKLMKRLLFPKISHINTTNQPFPEIYSDEKKSVLNTAFLAPLSYESASFSLLTRRESFEIQMMRCYMRLLPDSPFLLFYRDQGVNYWLLQSFSSAGSVTTTVVAKEPVPASQVKPSITQCIPHASGHLRLRSAFLLSPSVHCLHTLLQHSHQESFIAALFHQTACEASSDLDLTPASSTACDLLLRYAPQPSSALLLEADRWSEELAALRRNVEHPGEWRAVKTDEAGVTVGGGCEAQATDYASFLYAKGCACASAAELAAVMKQYLLAIPAQTPTPSLPSSNTTRLAEAVRRGLECVKQCLLCETEAQKEPLLQAWQEEVDALAELAELPALWQEAGVHSLQRRVATAFAEKKLLVSGETADAKSGLLQLQQSLRLLGYVNLLECFVHSHEPSHG